MDQLTPERDRTERESVTLVGPLPRPFGGVAVHLSRLGACLRTRGFRVINLSQGKVHPSVEVDAHLGNSVRRHYLDVRRLAQGIVHVHHAISPLTLAAVTAARMRGLTAVLSIHGYPFSALTRRRGYDVFLRRALRTVSGIVAVNDDIKHELATIAPTVPSWSLPAFLPPQDAELALASPELVRWMDSTASLGPLLSVAVYRVFDASPAAGASHDIYGLDLLSEAVEQLATDGHPSFRLALMLSIGPRTDAERRYLESRTRRIQAHLGSAFSLFESEYAPPVIAASRIFLRPSFTDGDSVAVREALALGIPVIASDAVTRPPGCRIFSSGSAACLARAISEELRSERSPTEVAVDSENFAQLLEVYRSLQGNQR